MTHSAYEEFAARYRNEPDEILLAALESGVDSYTPEAWRAIAEEVARRGLSAPEPRLAQPPSEQPGQEYEVSPLPRWLSATLLGLASLFLLLQLVFLLAFYGKIDTHGALLGSTGTLVFGATAWSATRFVRVGPHAAAARRIRLLALGLTAAAVLARL